MIFVSASSSSSSMCQSTGGSLIGLPSGPRDRIDARSNRNPSTCISRTQKSRHSTMNFSTTGTLQLNVLPQPDRFV